MMKRICCITLILLPIVLFAQKGITGIGFINLKLHNRTIESAKADALDLYAKPDGDMIAFLQKENPKYFFRKIVDHQGNCVELSPRNSGLVYMNSKYQGKVFQYYEEKDDFVRIKINAEYYWINLNDLAEVGEIISWKSYLSGIPDFMRVLYTMNLRTAPTINSDKIMVVRKINERRSLHLVEMTGNFEGNWAEVKIHIWEKGDYCETEQSDRTVKGWMKYLDDKGFPNVFPINFPCC